MIKKINQTNKQTKRQNTKQNKTKQNKAKQNKNRKRNKKGPFHWLAVDCTIFHPANNPPLSKWLRLKWQVAQSFHQTVAMIYFGRVWGPHKNSGPFGLKNFVNLPSKGPRPNPTKITPFLVHFVAKKGTFCRPPWLRACFPLLPPPPPHEGEK